MFGNRGEPFTFGEELNWEEETIVDVGYVNFTIAILNEQFLFSGSRVQGTPYYYSLSKY